MTALVLVAVSWRLDAFAWGLALRLAGASVFALGTVWPAAFRWWYVALAVLTYPVGWLVSRMLLGVVYFGLITPLAVCFRLRGRDVLKRRFAPGATTYWQPRVRQPALQDYYRQF
jgi:hypothetical protein